MFGCFVHLVYKRNLFSPAFQPFPALLGAEMENGGVCADVDNVTILVAETDRGAEGAQFSEGPLCEMCLEGIMKTGTLLVHVSWGGNEDAAMMGEDVLNEGAALGLAEMLENVDQKNKIVGCVEGFDDGLGFAYVHVVVDVVVEWREIILECFDTIDATCEMMIVLASVPEFEIFATEHAIFAESYTDIEDGMWIEKDHGIHDGGDLFVVARGHRTRFCYFSIKMCYLGYTLER